MNPAQTWENCYAVLIDHTGKELSNRVPGTVRVYLKPADGSGLMTGFSNFTPDNEEGRSDFVCGEDTMCQLWAIHQGKQLCRLTATESPFFLRKDETYTATWNLGWFFGTDT